MQKTAQYKPARAHGTIFDGFIVDTSKGRHRDIRGQRTSVQMQGGALDLPQPQVARHMTILYYAEYTRSTRLQTLQNNTPAHIIVYGSDQLAENACNNPQHHAPCTRGSGRPHTATAVPSQASTICALLAAHTATHLAHPRRSFKRIASLLQSSPAVRARRPLKVESFSEHLRRHAGR